MRRVRGKALANQFVKQGIEVYPEIDDTLRSPVVHEGSAWAPTNILGAIRVAARLTRLEEGPLASGVVRKNVRIAQDTPASTLVDILNSSIDRSAPPNEIAVEGGPISEPDSCMSAESYFLDALEELDRIENGQELQRTSQIIHSDFRPVVLRKSYDISSGLALQPIWINGIAYPAGSILAVKSKKTRVLRKSPAHKAVPISDIDKLTFIRLSAFALRPDERANSFYPGPDPYEDQTYPQDSFSSITMGDIGRLVSEGLVKITSPR